MKIKALVCSLFILFSMNAKAALWVAENTWSVDWEKKYSSWIQNEVTAAFFQEHQITTDCADAALSLRWIFSRINSLPMASNSSSGTLFTNLSSSWDGVQTASAWSQDQRFLKALKEINNLTSSKTLFKDLYPVKLTAQNLVAGTIFINATQDSGHVEWISRTDFDGQHSPLTFFSSTVPQQVRELLVYPFMKIKWPEKNKNGFMRFRWPVVANKTVALTPAEKMNDYSLEQYTLSDRDSSDFDDFIAGRLIGQSLDGLHKLQIYVSHLADRIEVRIPVVEEGFKICGGNKCPNSDSEVFYNHSTYSRDGAILFLIQGIQDLIYTNHTNQNIDDQMAGQMSLRWSQLQTEISFDLLGRSLNLGQIVNVWNQNLFSSDPNQSLQKRWGLAN